MHKIVEYGGGIHNLEKIQAHSTGILVALYEVWAMSRNLAGRAALFTESYHLRESDTACINKSICSSFP